MSVNYRFSIVVGIVVRHSDFFDTTPDTPMCAKGHLKGDTDGAFCAQDGTPFRPRQIDEQKPKVTEGAAVLEGDGFSPESYTVWEWLLEGSGENSLRILKGNALGGSMMMTKDIDWIFGVKLREMGTDSGTVGAMPLSMGQVDSWVKRINILAARMGLPQGASLFPCVYVSV